MPSLRGTDRPVLVCSGMAPPFFRLRKQAPRSAA